MKRRGFIGRATLAGASGFLVSKTMAAPRKKPNIVLIMGDDIGFADIGCFGGEIDTPNLDKLGFNGMRFAQGYNMAKCNPTRSAMLTGTFIGGKDCQSMGELMGKAGYSTLYVGKEHFDGWVPRERITAMNSFDHSLCHYGGAGCFFSHNPITFYHNEKKLEHSEVEANTSKPYYKTNAYTDYALRFLDETKDDGKPFFLYMAYESAHYPIHALKEDYAKFNGRYDVGWDEIRRKRFEKQKKLGIIKAGTQLSSPSGLKGMEYVPWKDVPADEKKKRLEEMTGFAAMVHCLDRNIGRVIKKIEERGELDNTLIMFLSDNGSCAFKRWKNDLHPTDPTSYRSLHSVWANVGDTPFRLFKQNGHEGGARTHMMAHWPAVIKKPSICWDVAHLVDFMPTFLEIAGGKYPSTQDGNPTPTLDGQSLIPLFKGQKRPDHKIIITGWTEAKRAIRQGDWKLVRDGGDWELYNVEKDPTELDDLSQKMPEKVEALLNLYADWRAARPYLPERQSGGGSEKPKDKSKTGKKKKRKKK
ncbi:MAG: arylsulfatase [Kiritimatiellales bacterium]|nr:arylsulfatase [Kiritimatiellales bacterium]